MANCKVYIKQFYKIDPKWKLMLLILVTSLSFMLYDWRFYLINLFITFFLSSLMGITYNQLCKQIGSYLYLLIIIFAMHTIGGDWINGIKVTLRFCNIIIFTSWITFTTPRSAIIEGLTCLLKPLSYVGLKPSKVSMSFALAIRFIALITDMLEQVKIAQKAKGIDKKFIAILIPLIIQAIKMADNIAEAIEARSWE